MTTLSPQPGDTSVISTASLAGGVDLPFARGTDVSGVLIVVDTHTTRDGLKPSVTTLGTLALTLDDGLLWKVASVGPVVWARFQHAHSDLTGLTADDHTLYLRTDGTRALTGDQSAGGHKLTNLASPVATTDAVNKAYADALASGLTIKPEAKAMADANIASLSGTITLDTIALVAGDRVLLTAQTTQGQNGIWLVASGAWTRPSDFAAGLNAGSSFFFIQQGTVHADQGWVCTADTPSDVVGTNGLPFVQFSAAGVIVAGNGLLKIGNSLAVNPLDASIAVAAGGVSLGVPIAPVTCATTGNLTLSGEQTIDGVTTSASRVLVWMQSTASQNGIYVSAAGAWARAADQTSAAQFRPGFFFGIASGTLYGGCLGVLLTDTAITVGTSTIQYGVTFAPPVAGADDGKIAVASGGLLTYVQALLSHTERRTAQTASLTAITLLTAPISDLYEVEIYLECTTAGSAGTVLATVSLTDDIGATTQVTTALSLTTTGRQGSRFTFWLASGDITFTTTVAGATGSPQYAVTARAVRRWSSN